MCDFALPLHRNANITLPTVVRTQPIINHNVSSPPKI